MILLTVTDSTILKVLDVISKQQVAPQTDNTALITSIVSVIIAICLAPLFIYLVKKWVKDNEDKAIKTETAMALGFEKMSSSIEKLTDTVSKTISDMKDQTLKIELSKKDIDDLKEAKYEHLKIITELEKNRHDVEIRLITLQKNYESVNEMSLKMQERYIEEMEDLQSLYENLKTQLADEINKHATCTSFKPLHP